MTTLQVMNAAYAKVFGFEAREDGRYHDQVYNGCTIDYAIFERDNTPSFDVDTDTIECIVESGCEGTWIRCELARYDFESFEYRRYRCGSVKTLDEGRSAWRTMGALAGEFAYLANDAAWKIYTDERRSAKEVKA